MSIRNWSLDEISDLEPEDISSEKDRDWMEDQQIVAQLEREDRNNNRDDD